MVPHLVHKLSKQNSDLIEFGCKRVVDIQLFFEKQEFTKVLHQTIRVT